MLSAHAEIIEDQKLVSRQLSFGCGALMRLQNSHCRQKLLAEAFASGIRRFDVARMYGLGHAEQELGDFIRDKRKDLYVTTKFGIEPAANISIIIAFQGIIRRILKTIPWVRNSAKKLAKTLYAPKCFSVTQAAGSLATSLQKLRTDYVDCLLLHDATNQDAIEPNLIEWLEEQKSKNRIRSFGMSGELSQLMAISEVKPELGRVLQFSNDILNRDIARVQGLNSAKLITYSPFSRAIPPLIAKYNSDREFANCWDALRKSDDSLPESFIGPAITYAMEANHDGWVIFSASSSDHLRKVITSVNNRSAYRRQIELLLKATN